METPVFVLRQRSFLKQFVSLCSPQIVCEMINYTASDGWFHKTKRNFNQINNFTLSVFA